MWIEVIPAYGRDYKNQAEVKAAWKENKDFQDTATGQYVNKSDADAQKLKVIVRYSRLTKVMQIK
jgi:hypothetical protein